MTKLHLDGIRILSMAEQYPGPYATMLLADLGADVIMIERPRGGDPTRRFAGHFEALNRNKRSIAIDLKASSGHSALLKLLSTADVFMEGFRPGVASRLGLGSDRLLHLRPELVYVSISGFGQTGPLRGRAGHDLTIQGAAGALAPSILGQPPPLPALPLADLSSAMFAAIGVLTALHHRRETGVGEHVDVSMFDSLISWLGTTISSGLNGLEHAPHPPNDPGYGVFTTADGDHITLSIAGEDHQWRALCEVLGLDDAASLNTADREARSSSITSALREQIEGRTTAWLTDRLDARGVPFGPVINTSSLVGYSHVVARELITRGAENQGRHRYVRQPIRFGAGHPPPYSPAPRLGEHTREVLAEVGVDVDALVATGVLALPDRKDMSP